jgi:hypothetical protein
MPLCSVNASYKTNMSQKYSKYTGSGFYTLYHISPEDKILRVSYAELMSYLASLDVRSLGKILGYWESSRGARRCTFSVLYYGRLMMLLPERLIMSQVDPATTILHRTGMSLGPSDFIWRECYRHINPWWSTKNHRPIIEVRYV